MQTQAVAPQAGHWGGVGSDPVLRPASFPSCRVHSFLHSYWCYNTSF